MLDVIIRGGLIVDGSGQRPPFKGDVGIKDDEILFVSNLEEEIGALEIDARGSVVAPGFIDINSHSDTHWTLFKYPSQESLLAQGVTTILGGNCGSSLAPILGEGSIKSLQKWINLKNVQIDWDRINELLDYLEDNKNFGVNFLTLVGHATLRRGILNEEKRALKNEELKILIKEVERAMKEGAFGLSAGLSYSHAREAGRKEILALSEVVKKAGGLMSFHLRNEDEDFLKSLKEIVEVAKISGVNTQISHLKVLGKSSWHFFDRALTLIEKANEAGAKINFDVYPYHFSGPVLYTLLPNWLTEGGRKELLSKLKNKRLRRKAILEMEKSSLNFGKLVIANCPFSKFLVKRKIEEIAAGRGVSPSEVVLDLILASEDQVTVFAKLLSERNVKNAISHDLSMVSSNGEGYALEEKESNNLVHPRSFGTFVRFLAHYVRDKKIMSLEKAIHKVTGQVANKIGLPSRGEIKEGYKADIQVFKLNNLEDHATLEHPYKMAEGVDWVFVNGKTAVKKGKIVSGARFGKILRKN